MLTPPDGVPWLAWAVVVIVLAAIGSLPATITALVTRRDTKAELSRSHETLRQVAEDAAASRSQTENEHVDAEYPNLRDELTAVRNGLSEVRAGLTDLVTTSERIRDDLGGLHSETRDLRKDVTGIRTDARRDRRKLADQEQALDNHLADVPRIVEEAFAKHAADCPARQQRES